MFSAEQRFLIASLVSSLICLTSVVEIGHVSTGLQQDTAATAFRLAYRLLLTKATLKFTTRIGAPNDVVRFARDENHLLS